MIVGFRSIDPVTGEIVSEVEAEAEIDIDPVLQWIYFDLDLVDNLAVTGSTVGQ